MELNLDTLPSITVIGEEKDSDGDTWYKVTVGEAVTGYVWPEYVSKQYNDVGVKRSFDTCMFLGSQSHAFPCEHETHDLLNLISYNVETMKAGE